MSNNQACGDVAAMREALSYIRRYTQMWIGTDVIDRTIAESIVATCAAALAAPARNCDVGTPEEQLERWESFCNRNWNRNYASRGLDPCDDCELVEFGNCRCQLAWAQLPYEAAKEGGAE